MTRKNRKDVEFEVSYEKADQLYSDLIKWSGNGFAGIMFEGVLLDEYAIVMTDNQNWKVSLSKGRPVLARKYVYIEEKYVSCWSSQNILVLTDNKNRFEKFCKSRFDDGQDFEDFCHKSGLDD